MNPIGKKVVVNGYPSDMYGKALVTGTIKDLSGRTIYQVKFENYIYAGPNPDSHHHFYDLECKIVGGAKVKNLPAWW